MTDDLISVSSADTCDAHLTIGFFRFALAIAIN